MHLAEILGQCQIISILVVSIGINRNLFLIRDFPSDVFRGDAIPLTLTWASENLPTANSLHGKLQLFSYISYCETC